MSVEPRYIDIHVVQPLPYSLANRDDLGQHKTLNWNTPRLRISSQSWKRRVRQNIEPLLEDPTMRTRHLVHQVASVLVTRGWSVQLANFAAANLAEALGMTPAKKDLLTAAMLYITQSQIEELADLVVTHKTEYEAALTKALAKAVKSASGTEAGSEASVVAVPPKDLKLIKKEDAQDIIKKVRGTVGLLGRFIAEVPGSTVDGAVSIAHAFTTHTAVAEEDFFTAVEDVATAEDHNGSAHMGHAEYGAGVYYRYASIDMLEMAKNLNGESALSQQLVSLFIENFVKAVPLAKKNSGAHYSEPDLIVLRVRADRPQSLAGAFEKPVKATNQQGLSEASRAQLSKYAEDSVEMFGDDGLVVGWVINRGGAALPALGNNTNFKDATASVLGLFY